MLVISMPLIPQGVICSKGERSPHTFIAKPCIEIQWRTPMPIDAILRSPHQTPVNPLRVVLFTPNSLQEFTSATSSERR